VTCVNCAVERLFVQAPVPVRSRRMIVKRGSLIIEVPDRSEAAKADR
jgi:hypothetical protein